jgi:hypothetical protein
VQTRPRSRKIGPYVEVYRSGEASDDGGDSCYVWIDQKQGDHFLTLRDDCKKHVVCGLDFTSGGPAQLEGRNRSRNRISWNAPGPRKSATSRKKTGVRQS